MKIIECEQLSPAWWEARRGIPTASSFDKILTPRQGKLSASILPYICQLIADVRRVGPRPEEQASPAMLHGTRTEAEARRWYALERNVDVRQVGFCTTDDGRFGCSPDGLVGEDGGLELKCPQLETHVAYLLDGGLPDEYRCQVHGELIVTGRAWWDFMSYFPGETPLLVRVEPDDFTQKLRDALEVFWLKYLETLAKLRGRESA